MSGPVFSPTSIDSENIVTDFMTVLQKKFEAPRIIAQVSRPYPASMLVRVQGVSIFKFFLLKNIIQPIRAVSCDQKKGAKLE
jgi:hypothetical protein